MRKAPDHTRLNHDLSKAEATVSNAFTLAWAQYRPVTEAELAAAVRLALGRKLASHASHASRTRGRQRRLLLRRAAPDCGPARACGPCPASRSATGA